MSRSARERCAKRYDVGELVPCCRRMSERGAPSAVASTPRYDTGSEGSKRSPFDKKREEKSG